MHTIEEVNTLIGVVSSYIDNMLQSIENKGVTIPQDASYGMIPYLISQIGSSPEPPGEDTQLNWIENGEGSYIDLGYIMTKPGINGSDYVSVEIKYNRNNSGSVIVGCDGNPNVTNYLRHRWNIIDQEYPKFNCGNSESTSSVSINPGSTVTVDTRRYEPKSIVSSSNGSSYITVNGTQTEGNTKFYEGCNYSLYLYGNHTSSGVDNLCASGTRVFYVKIIDSGTIIKNYVPYFHDGKPCLFETIGSTYHYNIGSGTLNYG